MKTRLLLSLILLTAVLPLHAQEGGGAEALYDENCIKCHGPEVYTRADRKVTSLDGLERQVQRCELALGLRWFDEDIADMTRFLNEKYYHFAP
jgi:mono/diheme cytochrome c family protein